MNAASEYIQLFQEKLRKYIPQERESILHAAEWAYGLHENQKRASGEPYIVHPLRVAEILIENNLDHKAIVAALLHDVLEDTSATEEELERRFSPEIGALVHGVTKISILKGKTKTIQQAETIRKMLLAMIKDIRVILIKLADKLHNMRTLEHLDAQSRKRIATECLDIYAPLAGRLGMSRMKDELEDL